jgi:hypothetical protein
MPIRTCPECGNRFETSLPAGTPCGLRRCPSGQAGTGKPPKTTAAGKPIDDRRAKAGAKRATRGYVQQRSTGFDALDGCLPVVVVVLALLAALGTLASWGTVELVAWLAGA